MRYLLYDEGKRKKMNSALKACYFGDNENQSIPGMLFSTTIGVAGVFSAYCLFFQNSASVSISLAIQAGSAFLGMDVCQRAINFVVKKARTCIQSSVVQEGVESIIRLASQEIIMLSLMQSMKYLVGEYDKKTMPEIFSDTRLFLSLMTIAFGTRELLRSVLVLNRARLGWKQDDLTLKQSLLTSFGPLIPEAIIFVAGGFIHDPQLGRITTAFVTGGTLNVGTKFILNRCLPTRVIVRQQEEEQDLLRSEAGHGQLPHNIDAALYNNSRGIKSSTDSVEDGTRSDVSDFGLDL